MTYCFEVLTTRHDPQTGRVVPGSTEMTSHCAPNVETVLGRLGFAHNGFWHLTTVSINVQGQTVILAEPLFALMGDAQTVAAAMRRATIHREHEAARHG